MVIVVLSGGIGAQVFQFAAGYQLAKKNNCRLLLDTCWFNKKNKFATKPLTIGDFLELKNHIIIKNIWISRLIRFFFKIVHTLSFGKYNYLRINFVNPLEYKVIPKFKNLFLNGHMQNIDYFKKNIFDILKKIKVETNKTPSGNSMNENIKSIAIHVRKGDQKNGPVDFLNNKYYQKGVNEIINRANLSYENINIVIFCEEMEWPKNNLFFDKRINKIEYVIGDDDTAIKDLKKMIDCDYIIMSNSGFSWWAAAYINKIKNGYVICPNLWWNRIPVEKTNIYLKDWIIVETDIAVNDELEFTA